MRSGTPNLPLCLYLHDITSQRHYVSCRFQILPTLYFATHRMMYYHFTLSTILKPHQHSSHNSSSLPVFSIVLHYLSYSPQSQGSTCYCIAHGGGRRCTYPGCGKGARDKFFCAGHGGGKVRIAHTLCILTKHALLSAETLVSNTFSFLLLFFHRDVCHRIARSLL